MKNLVQKKSQRRTEWKNENELSYCLFLFYTLERTRKTFTPFSIRTKKTTLHFPERQLKKQKLSHVVSVDSLNFLILKASDTLQALRISDGVNFARYIHNFWINCFHSTYSCMEVQVTLVSDTALSAILTMSYSCSCWVRYGVILLTVSSRSVFLLRT